MHHYRLKVNKLDGDYIPAEEGGIEPFTSEHMRTARSRAIQAAQQYGVPIAIERHSAAPLEGREGFERGRDTGMVRTVLVIDEDGGARPPAGSKVAGLVSTCRKGPGRPPCFCPNCRAERRKS